MGTSQSLNLSSASNSFTGGLFVNGGTLMLTHANAGNGNDVTVNAFGRLAIGAGTSGNPVLLGGLSGDGQLLIRPLNTCT